MALTVGELLDTINKGIDTFQRVKGQFRGTSGVLHVDQGQVGTLPGGEQGGNLVDSPYVPDFLEGALYGTKGLQNCNIGQVTHVPRYEQRIKCDRGFVAVRCRDEQGNAVEMCMYKPVARALGLWKARKKPPISVKDATAIRRSEAAGKRIKEYAKKVNALPAPKRRSSKSA